MEKQAIKDSARRLLDPVVAGLDRIGFTPTLVSILGLAISIYGGVVLARGELFVAGVWLLIAGLCDVLDGSLARRQGSASPLGAFLDSTLDRVAEAAYLAGAVVYFVRRPDPSVTAIVFVLMALVASFLVSYTRARLEGLGYECRVGVMERPERIAVLILGLLLGSRMLVIAVVVLAFGSVFTVLQRIHHAVRVTRPGRRDETGATPTDEPDKASPDETDTTPPPGAKSPTPRSRHS